MKVAKSASWEGDAGQVAAQVLRTALVFPTKEIDLFQSTLRRQARPVAFGPRRIVPAAACGTTCEHPVTRECLRRGCTLLRNEFLYRPYRHLWFRDRFSKQHAAEP